jgi:NADH:ubiquinone oxidoreductase subunit 6 (subunit J)
MKCIVLILLLIFSTVHNVYSQNSAQLSTDEIFSGFQQNAQNAEEVNADIYSQYVQAINSDKYTRETKAKLTSLL